MSDYTMVDILQIVDVYLTYPVFVFSSAILLLSIRMAATSLGRTCCANIAVPSFISTFLFIMTRFMDRTTRFFDFLRNSYVFFRAFSLHGYVYFSTLTVFLAYIGYAKPFHFQRYVSKRLIIVWCIVGYLWATLMTFLAFPKVMIVDILGLFSYETNFAIPMTFQAVIALLFYGVMLSLYVLTLVKIKATRTLMQRSSWNTLKSVLIYCTPPNVFAAVAICGYVCESTAEIEAFFQPLNITVLDDWDSRQDHCSAIRVWSQQSTNIRLFITSITSLIAFYEYRRAVVECFRKPWYYASSLSFMPKCLRSTVVTAIESSALFRRSNPGQQSFSSK